MASTSVQMSQQFLHASFTNSLESAILQKLLTVIILLSLGWNSLQFQYHLHYNSQHNRKFNSVGYKPVICSEQVDILVSYFQPLLHIYNNPHWPLHLIRLKPPWSLTGRAYFICITQIQGINGFFSYSENSTLTYHSFSSVLGRSHGLSLQKHKVSTILQKIVKFHIFTRPIYSLIMLPANTSGNKRQKSSESGSQDSSDDQYSTFSNMRPSSIATFQACCDQIFAIPTPYPELRVIVSLLRQQSQAISEESVQAFFDKHAHYIRVLSPITPTSLNQAIMQIITNCTVASKSSTHLTLAATYLLALAWAALKAISGRHRRELLERELANITPKLGTFSMPSSSVDTVKHALQVIYFAQISALDSTIANIHTTVLQLLPQEAHSRASSMVAIEGDDASQHIPTILLHELVNFTNNRSIAQEIVSQRDLYRKTPSTGSGSTDFPELPTMQKSQDIWRLNTKSAPQVLTPTPQCIRLPIPIHANPPTTNEVTAARRLALAHRTSLPDDDRRTIPAGYKHVEESVLYDEMIIITRFIWVVGLIPCTILADADLNRLSTIGEHQHVVRMLGTLSEDPKCSQYLTYSNGLMLDQAFSSENFSYIYDAKRGGTILKLLQPATFGSSQAPGITMSASTIPMVQRIPSAMPVHKNIHQIYTVQAISESSAQAFFNSATTLASVRGIPNGLQSHSLAAACLLGTTDVVRASIVQSGKIDPSEYTETTFMTLLFSMKHFVKLVDNKTDFPNFKIYTDKKGTPIIPLSRNETPKEVIEVEELGIEVIWLQDTNSTYGGMYKALRDSFKSDPIKSFFVCGIPLEMALSPLDFRKHPRHLQTTSEPLTITIVCNVRSCLPVREMFFHLEHNPGNSADPQRFISGAFILHAAQAADGSMRPWSMLFIWNAHSPTLDLYSLRPLAVSGSPLRFHGTNRLAAISTMGCLQFVRLGQAAKTTTSTRDSNSKALSSSRPAPKSGQRSPFGQQPKTRTPTTPTSQAVYAPPTLRSTHKETHERDGWASTGAMSDGDGDMASSELRQGSGTMTEDGDDSGNEDEDSDYSPSESSSTVAVISAAKASPLLTLTSSVVNNLSDHEVAQMGDSDPGVRLIERMIQTTMLASVQPTINDLQQRLASTQNLAANAELRQIAQEFRSNRRAYTNAANDLEDLAVAIQSPDASPQVRRQHARAETSLKDLHNDMMNVLSSLRDQCARYELDIHDFISPEDANLLGQEYHE